MEKRFNFTITNHQARIELGLTMNEYAVADLIYHLSNNPEEDGNWCYASKIKLGKYLGLSEKSIHIIISKLLKYKIVEKNELTKYLRTTKDWYNNVIIKYTEQSSARLKYQTISTLNKVQPDTEQSSAPIYDKDIYKDNKEYIRKFNELFGTRYKPTMERNKKLTIRLKNFTLEEIIKALEKLAASKFHRGDNERGWVATPDFLLRSDEKIDEWLNKSNKKSINGFSEGFKVYKA